MLEIISTKFCFEKQNETLANSKTAISRTGMGFLSLQKKITPAVRAGVILQGVLFYHLLIVY